MFINKSNNKTIQGLTVSRFRSNSNKAKMEANWENNDNGRKILSPCDVEALKKCLEENKGDQRKCQSQIEAFKTSCSIKKPNSSSDSPQKFQSWNLIQFWLFPLFHFQAVFWLVSLVFGLAWVRTLAKDVFNRVLNTFCCYDSKLLYKLQTALVMNNDAISSQLLWSELKSLALYSSKLFVWEHIAGIRCLTEFIPLQHKYGFRVWILFLKEKIPVVLFNYYISQLWRYK